MGREGDDDFVKVTVLLIKCVLVKMSKNYSEIEFLRIFKAEKEETRKGSTNLQKEKNTNWQ